MKKIITLVLTLIMALALVACGAKDKTSSDKKSTTDTSQQEEQQTLDNNNDNNTAIDIDFGSIMTGTGATDTVWGKQDEKTKQAVIDEGKKEGLEVSFDNEGSMTVEDPENESIIVQKPDGSWVFNDEDGEGQIGGEWPDNEYTKLIPKPNFDFSIQGAGTGEDTFAVMFANATFDQIRDYAEEVKSAGFSIDEDVYESGTAIYNYMAANADGYKVEVSFANGISSLSVSKQ